ncbi:Imm50 family immunity protein [Streptomyces sp. DT203]|uniref:Imm50 family immunity protein n=1 Tax=Streptomyces sp. DT203 TaxID=3393424 RepID=UPI003CE876ED
MARSLAQRNTITMTSPWVSLVRNPSPLSSLYSTIPPLRAVRLRSIHLNWRGPAVTLRIDLPTFPDKAPADWLARGHDAVQLHLQFLAVNDISIKGWLPPVQADIAISLVERHRILVGIEGTGIRSSFSSSDSVIIGHISAFTTSVDGFDGGDRSFLRPLDSRRFDSLPDVYEGTYYERI